MLRKIEGTVQSYKALNVRHVEFQVQGSNDIIDLCLDRPWVLRDGDHVVVTGENDGRSGRFHGYAYRNDSREVCGMSDNGWAEAGRYILLGLLFAWAIFPLFTFLPAGLRWLDFGRKVDRAADMIGCNAAF